MNIPWMALHVMGATLIELDVKENYTACNQDPLLELCPKMQLHLTSGAERKSLKPVQTFLYFKPLPLKLKFPYITLN